MLQLITIILALLFTNSYANPNIRELNIYIAANYLSEQTANRFNQRSGYKVIQNYFNENDVMLAKMAAGLNGYDIIVPTSYAVDQLTKMNKLQKLDFNKIPNFKYIDPKFKNLAFDPNNQYSIPYAYDNVFLAYNKKALQKLGINADSWKIIFDPQYLSKLKGKVTVFDSPRNVFAAALLYLGKDPNTTNLQDLKKARDTIAKAAPYWKRYDSDTYARTLVNGSIYVAMSYSVDIFNVVSDMKNTHQEINIGMALQQEGNMYELDSWTIPKKPDGR